MNITLMKRDELAERTQQDSGRPLIGGADLGAREPDKHRVQVPKHAALKVQTTVSHPQVINTSVVPCLGTFSLPGAPGSGDHSLTGCAGVTLMST